MESLFIDEGFGSVDLATLNIAMDALERLHNKRRKVGAISCTRNDRANSGTDFGEERAERKE